MVLMRSWRLVLSVMKFEGSNLGFDEAEAGAEEAV